MNASLLKRRGLCQGSTIHRGGYVKRYKICALVMMAIVCAGSSPAASEGPKSADVNAVTGLAPVLILSCTDVSLGVWSIKPGVRGGTNTITQSMSGGATRFEISGIAGGAALAAGASSVPVAGTCTLFNATDLDAAKGRLKISRNVDIEFDTADVLNRKKPPKKNGGLRAKLWVDKDEVPECTASGILTWRILGEVTIPEGIEIDNYGGYTAATSAIATYNPPD